MASISTRVVCLLGVLVGTQGSASYVPEGAEYVVKQASSHLQVEGEDLYNVLQVQLYLNKPDLTLQWYTVYDAAQDYVYAPVPEGSTTVDGRLVITEVQQLITNGTTKNYSQLSIEGGNFLSATLGFIIPSFKPLQTVTANNLEQRYITNRPGPVARFSEGKPAEITAEVWSQNPNDRLFVRFRKGTDPEVAYVLYSLNTNSSAETVDGVKARVNVEQHSGLAQFTIHVETTISGLVSIVFNTRHLGKLTMLVESVDETEETWVDEHGYSGFLLDQRKDSSPSSAEPLLLQCGVLGPHVSPHMVYITRDGSTLSTVKGAYFGPSYVNMLYVADGPEKGKYECIAEDANGETLVSLVTNVD